MMIKVIVFGNQQISIECIKILTKIKEVELMGVIGCENQQDRLFGYPSVKEYCQKSGVSYFNPNRLDNQFLELIRNLRPDLCFSIYYRNIFSPSYISVPSMGFINIHPSSLPKYRGPIPTFWALLNNEKKTGVTLHYIDSGIDSGDIIAQIDCEIPKEITGNELNNLLIEKGAELFREQLPFILKKENKRIKQNHVNATYFGPFNQKLRIINWYLPVKQINRQIQALAKPYCGVKASIIDKEIFFWKAQVVEYSKEKLSGPGKIIKVQSDEFMVSGVDGFLMIKDFEIAETSRSNKNKYIKIGNSFNLS